MEDFFRVIYQWGLVWGASLTVHSVLHEDHEVIVQPTQGMALECKSKARLHLQALWPHPSHNHKQAEETSSSRVLLHHHKWPHSCAGSSQPSLGESTILQTCQQTSRSSLKPVPVGAAQTAPAATWGIYVHYIYISQTATTCTAAGFCYAESRFWKQSDNSQHCLKALLTAVYSMKLQELTCQKLLQIGGEIPTAFKFVKAS